MARTTKSVSRARTTDRGASEGTANEQPLGEGARKEVL